MFAKYIMRLDDACPTMNRTKWLKIEQLCEKYDIKPIIAVIPNNKDPMQIKNSYDYNFWDKVRNWKKKGWYIALHGYDHIYLSRNSGLVPFNQMSEFAGLSYNQQSEKIKKGIKILQAQNIIANLWVAPAHTFDKNTLKALKNNTDINTISDGIAIYPFKKYGFNWIPQQFWHFRKMPFGVWTSCFHPNNMSDKEFNSLKLFIEKNHKNFITIDQIKYKKFCILNILFEKLYWSIKKIKAFS